MFRTRRLALVLGAAASVVLLAGCATSSNKPTFSPQPGSTLEPGRGPNFTPGVGEPGAGGSSSGSSSSGSGTPSSPGGSSSSATDPAVVATNLSAPVGIAVLPDLSALVAERTTGRILQVQPEAGQPDPVVRTVTGLDASGDGGLMDIALSPTYSQDGLIYAYITTATDNEVVDFTLAGPATPVVTGIPKGTTGNLGRILFDTAGDLLIGTGDAGRPALAADPNSLAGKVLEVSAVGQPLAGKSQIASTGHQNTAGLCVDSDSGTAVQMERAGGTASDEINVLAAGKNYGWPTATSASVASSVSIPSAEGDLGGCAIVSGSIYVTSLTGSELLSMSIDTSGSTVKFGKITESLKGTYGRLANVVASSDGSLWLTTSNKDGQGKPIATDERVLHLPPPSGGPSSTL